MNDRTAKVAHGVEVSERGHASADASGRFAVDVARRFSVVAPGRPAASRPVLDDADRPAFQLAPREKRGLRVFGAMCAAGVLCACLLAGCQSSDAASDAAAPDAGQDAQTPIASTKMRGAAVGQPAPDAPLVLLDGTETSIAALQGNVTVLSFWGTWCPYCIKEMPDLQRIKENYPDVNVVLVNCGEDESVVSDFAQRQGFDFMWALDSDYEVQRAYPTSGIPYTAVIDASGTVSDIFAGSAREMYPHFEEAVNKAMG